MVALSPLRATCSASGDIVPFVKCILLGLSLVSPAAGRMRMGDEGRSAQCHQGEDKGVCPHSCHRQGCPLLSPSHDVTPQKGDFRSPSYGTGATPLSLVVTSKPTSDNAVTIQWLIHPGARRAVGTWYIPSPSPFQCHPGAPWSELVAERQHRAS